MPRTFANVDFNVEINVAPLIEGSVAPLSPLHADRRHAMCPLTSWYGVPSGAFAQEPSLQVSRNPRVGECASSSGGSTRTTASTRAFWFRDTLGSRMPKESHQESFGGPQCGSSASRKSNDWASEAGGRPGCRRWSKHAKHSIPNSVACTYRPKSSRRASETEAVPGACGMFPAACVSCFLSPACCLLPVCAEDSAPRNACACLPARQATVSEFRGKEGQSRLAPLSSTSDI